MTPLGVVRLPLDERLHIKPATPASESSDVVARHELRFFGITFAVFDYTLTRRA